MNDNVVFYLTFKKDLKFLFDTLPLREALNLMRAHGYSAVPVINAQGEYVGSVSEGDFLWFLIDHRIQEPQLDEVLVRELIRPGFMPSVDINVSLDQLQAMALRQNYVPVVDDRSCFMGIVTRQTLLRQFGLCSRCPVRETIDQ